MIFFYLLVSVMPMARHPLWAEFIGDLTLIKYLGVLCLMYALLWLRARRTPIHLFGSWQARCFAALALLGMGSHLTMGSQMDFEVSPFMNYLSFLIFLFITLVLIDSLPRLQWTLLTAAGSIAYASLHTVREWQKYGGMAAGYRPGWITGDPNYFSVSAALCLPVVFYLIRSGQARWERWFCIGSLAVTLFAVTLAASRGALLAIAASFVLIALRSRQRVRTLVAGALLLIPLLVLSPTSPLERWLSPSRDDRESTENRTRAWEAGLAMIQRFPLTGIGVGNFKPLVAHFGNIEEARVAHNTYIGIAAELGLPGLLLFLAIVASAFRSLARTRALARDPSSLPHRAALGIEGGLVAFLVAIVFISAEYQKFFWLMVFLSAALEPLARAQASRGPVPATGVRRPVTA